MKVTILHETVQVRERIDLSSLKAARDGQNCSQEELTSYLRRVIESTVAKLEYVADFPLGGEPTQS